MVFVLLVSADSKRGVRMREALTAQGWWATLVTDREGALRAAADHEPEVVIVDENVMGATELVKIFTSLNGGPAPARHRPSVGNS
jgi:DNA-binding response OmpR family regulator